MGAPAAERDGDAVEAVLIRHAETEWSRDHRHTGRTDIPLTELGRQAALTLRARLAPWRFELVLMSPLARARETCELAGLEHRARVEENLCEWDYGEYEGLTTDHIRRLRPGWNLWRDGCPGGEDAGEVGIRADRVIAKLQRAGGAVALFSHGHMLRVLGARWAALDARQGSRLALSTGAICVLGHEHELPAIISWNDISGTQAAAAQPVSQN